MRHSEKRSRLWRRVGFWVGVVVLMVPAFAVVSRIDRLAGLGGLGLVTFAATFGAAWMQHTERSRILVDEFSAALTDEGISDKECAHLMDVPQSVLSEWRGGTKQLSLARAASLPDRFWVAFCRRVIARWGGGKVEVLDTPVAELVALIRASLLPKRMASMTLEAPAKSDTKGVA
jgi:hypothetical protein